MDFLDILKPAAQISAAACRKIARETAGSIDPALVGGSNPYGSESEARFKAFLDGNLLHVVDGKDLSLEPGPVYSNVDLVYCKGGLTWRLDNSEVVLIEVKRAAKLKTSDGLVSNAIREIEGDVRNLQSAKLQFKNARLVSIVAFVDYDAETYDAEIPSLEKHMLNQFAQNGTIVSEVAFILC